MTAATEHSDHDSPSAPTLLVPRDGAYVDGDEVTFAWDPVEEADRYRLQIAETARFDDLVLDEDVGVETAVTVGNQLPTDGQTFFWRVLAGAEAGWSDEPKAVESFVATTADESEQDMQALRGEGAGPVTGLARAARQEIPQSAFEFEDRMEEEKERGVAYEGIAASQIMAIAVAILVVILVAVVVLFGWYGQVSQETRAAASDPNNYQLLQRTESEAMQQLTGYGVVDQEQKIYRIPIERAMDVVATEEYQRSQSTAESDASESQ